MDGHSKKTWSKQLSIIIPVGCNNFKPEVKKMATCSILMRQNLSENQIVFINWAGPSSKGLEVKLMDGYSVG